MEANGRLIDSIGKVQAEIDALHGKTIEINTEPSRMSPRAGRRDRGRSQAIPDEKTIRINTIYADGTGNAGDGQRD